MIHRPLPPTGGESAGADETDEAAGLDAPPAADPFGDEYAALDTRTLWPVASLLCFVVALAARPLAGMVPRELLGYPWRVLLPALAVPAASLVGLLCGLWGLGGETGRGLARLGILVNAVGLVLGALAILAFFYILRR
jgi:hypothetical protein